MEYSDVQNLSVFERLIYWINERENIRRQKDAGGEGPYTDDPILSQFRFCNVRRMDDRVSKWLMDNWYQPHDGKQTMLAACALARFINLPAALDQITEYVFSDVVFWEAIKNTLRERRERGEPIFNGAYMVRGNDGEDKVSSVVDFYVKPMWENHRQSSLIRPHSMQRTHYLLKNQHGFGSFMAGQVVADLRHAVVGDWADRYTWAPSGPGSQRGLSRLLGKPLRQQYPDGVFNDYLSAIIDQVGSLLPPEITERLEAHDWQNCLCEFDKYERVLWGEGKPKQLYRPRPSEEVM